MNVYLTSHATVRIYDQLASAQDVAYLRREIITLLLEKLHVAGGISVKIDMLSGGYALLLVV